MLTNRILSSVKSSDIILETSTDGLDDTTVIPTELDKCITKPVVSVTDLGKLLLQCCKDGETTKVHELMCRGAPFSTDWLGTSPIHLAAMNNHLSTCEVLLRAGISKDAKTKVDRTPLHFAVYEGHEKMVDLLLKHKCEVDARDMLKMTPLHWAVEKKHKRIVEMLMEHNADPNVISKFDKTPLIIAHETSQMDIVKILEQAISNRLENPDQTQEATDQLVYEMQQESSNSNNDQNCRIPPLTPIELDNDYQNIFNMSGNQAAPSPGINSLMDNTSMIDDDSNIIEDSDDGTSLSEAIIQLQNIDEPKAIDASALQLLKEHGISMLNTEDTDNSLITSALQSGRKLVLSEAGKLVLNDPKFRKFFMDGSPTPSSNSHPPPLVKPEPQIKLASKKPTMIVSARNFPLKTNKVIKILSAEQFKQMCGGDLTNAIKKISHDPQKDVRFNSTTGKSPTVIHLNTPKVKKPVMSKTKINLNPTLKSSFQFKSPPVHAVHHLENGIETQSRIPIHPLNQQTKFASPTLTTNRFNPNSNNNNNNNINNNNNNNSNINNNSVNRNEVSGGSMTMQDMEKQIVDMRRIIEELVRKFELSQKQNDELRLKVQRLERERELDDHRTNHNTDDIEILEYTNCID